MAALHEGLPVLVLNLQVATLHKGLPVLVLDGPPGGGSARESPAWPYLLLYLLYLLYSLNGCRGSRDLHKA